MSKPKPLIDFEELVSAVPGEGLEELVRQLGRRKGLSPTWSGRGSDGGRDLLFAEILSGPISNEKNTWLVSCKDKAKSGKSVNERDLPSPGVKDKLAQHKADGFLLVTTTTVSTGAKALLDGLDISQGGEIRTLVWDSSELTAMLLEPSNQDLLKQFLPKSYQKVRGLTSLEGAVLSFRDQLPEDVLTEVMKLVRPYSGPSLKGTLVWPYDSESAAEIDQIVKYVLVNQDLNEAVQSTQNIEYDAFVKLVEQMHKQHPEECYAYLSAIVLQHPEQDVKFNAAQFLFDNYEISPPDRMRFATQLDSGALAEIYSSEVAGFVEDELLLNTPNYSLYSAIDELSSATQIDGILITTLELDSTRDSQIKFSGKMVVQVTLVFEGDKSGSHDLPGSFSGYFDEHGIYLEETFVDT